MKKTVVFGLLGIILAFSLTFTSCLDSPGDEGGGGGSGGNIPQEWRTTYKNSANRSVSIGADFLVYANMLWPGTVLYGSGTLTGMSVEGEGTITHVSDQVGGKYVYLLRNGQRFGLLVYVEGLGRLIGLGNRSGGGADDLINTVVSSGGIFNPPATAVGMPTDFSWSGDTFSYQ